MGLKCVRTSSTAFFLFLILSLLYTLVSKNVVSVSDISAVNLIVGWCLFACSMNLLISSLLTFQSEKNVIYEMFLNQRFYHALVKDVCFNFRNENVGKDSCHFSTHGGSVCLWIVFSTKLEGIFL